jgi:hypothetical protein
MSSELADHFDMNTQSLEYSSSYNCHCLISLDCGREITLTSLKQEMTYAALLEGTPDSETNVRHLLGLVKRVRNPWRLQNPGPPPFLIAPERRDYLRVQGDMASIRSEYRIPEWMPLITCIGTFESSRISDKKMDASCLTIIWFQDNYAMPVSRAALAAIKSIDWAAHSFDFGY